MTPVQIRLAAARAIGRVLRSGAWSNVVIRVEAQEDTPKVQALVLGVLRRLPLIDGRIEAASGRDLSSVDPSVLDILRVGALELGDDPSRHPGVVVDTVVRAVGELAPRARGFANAVMRRVSEQGVFPDAATPDAMGIPLWLHSRVARMLGEEGARSFWRASQEPAQVGIRSDRAVEGAVSVAGIPGAWLTTGAPPDAPIQDPASIAVGLAVDARPGDRVLDVGAAPGGKTRHLVEQVEGPVIALDVHPRRVRDASRRVPLAQWVVGDGRRPPFAAKSFDRVLVDAPCSGLGILRRRPEIRYRVTEEEIERLADLQGDILDACLPLVRPGGRLVYSVCTITPDETTEVINGRGAHPPEQLPGVVCGDGTLLAPHLGPTDGMFIAVIDR